MPIVCLKHINQPIQSTPSSPLSDTISNRILFTFKILPIANKKTHYRFMSIISCNVTERLYMDSQLVHW